MKLQPVKFIHFFLLITFSVVIFIISGLLMGESTAHALPEYANRTSESCGTCHVNPGGGGPRTLRGMLWVAQGRPDKVPVIENLLIAPGVSDGMELYELACAGCHGAGGEGLFGSALVGVGLTQNKIKSTIVRGRIRSGMPAFSGQFSDDQLNTLVEYVYNLASGKISPPPPSYPLDSTIFTGCVVDTQNDKCGGN